MYIEKMGVRTLVEFICRQGSIDNSFKNGASALEGTRIHQKIQKSQGENYQSEIQISHEFQIDENILLILSGRMDGLFYEDGNVAIDEIKSTYMDLEAIEAPFNEHLSQAKFYGYMYALQNQLEKITIRLTYVSIDDLSTKYFYETYLIKDLEEFAQNIIHSYKRFIEINMKHRELRNQSLQALTFPYKELRPGQKEMALSCFKAIKEQETLMIQAATGIGKTLSTLYPSLKALGQNMTSKIMYLTAKTITRQVAIDSLNMIDAHLRYVVITAKEKICPLKKATCTADKCEYANNHFARVNDAIYDCLTHENHFTREIVEQYALKHKVCPFEFSLDLFLFSDVSISDYNYAFDPRVNLKRAFDTNNDYILLVDEAHNLVDRARNMYSSQIELDVLKKCYKMYKPKKGKCYRKFKKLLDYVKELDTKDTFTQEKLDLTLVELCKDFCIEAREYLPELNDDVFKEQLTDTFFMANDIVKISEYYNSDYISYYENHIYHLFCLNPSRNLIPIYKSVRSVILFSATLLPIQYFFSLLGGTEKTKKLYYPSPFDNQNMCLLVANDIYASYGKRSLSYQDIPQYLNKLHEAKKGHYIVFFPSYQYLETVYDIAKEMYPDIPFTKQEREMDEAQKEQFLDLFKQEPDKTHFFFLVLGGIFSEGIDLKGEQCIGVVIVSVGLPQICLERELISNHFEDGFAYAYTYPGFNKVLQAAGRLIRTSQDRGVVLLLDKRYQTNEYLKLFPTEWHHASSTNLRQITNQLSNFYNISVEK